ncbi:RPM1-interacting protein 4 [Spatholobus suberectus]|nr:RPM1-interacting protein 4 [Spatholobus suberectus]
MENPEAFNMCTRVGENVDADEAMASHGYSHNGSSLERGSHGGLGNHTRRHLHHRSRGSHDGLTAEFASDRSHFDHSVIQRGPQSDHKRNVSKGGSIKSFSSSSHSRHKGRSSSFNDHSNHEATAIPKFGTWDVTNPKSGEDYTAVFGKIKEERQNTSSHVSSISSTPPLNNCSNIKNQYGGPSSGLSKYCCCLFPSEGK